MIRALFNQSVNHQMSGDVSKFTVYCLKQRKEENAHISNQRIIMNHFTLLNWYINQLIVSTFKLINPLHGPLR